MAMAGAGVLGQSFPASMSFVGGAAAAVRARGADKG
jgi:hypothetical protein